MSNGIAMYSVRKNIKNGSGLRGDPANDQNDRKFTRMFRKGKTPCRNDDLVRGMDISMPVDQPLVYGYSGNNLNSRIHDVKMANFLSLGTNNFSEDRDRSYLTTMKGEDREMGMVYGKEDKRKEIWTNIPLEWKFVWINFVLSNLINFF